MTHLILLNYWIRSKPIFCTDSLYVIYGWYLVVLFVIFFFLLHHEDNTKTKSLYAYTLGKKKDFDSEIVQQLYFS